MSQEQGPVEKKERASNKKARPTKILATDRIKFEKQLELLRAYGVASGADRKPVQNREAAGYVNMKESTSTHANAFFVGSGLLARGDGGFIPCEEVLALARAFQWNPETANRKLAPVLQRTWFAEALLPKLQFGALSEVDAINILADLASAGPEYERNLRATIDYLEVSNLVQRDGDQIRLASQGMESPTVIPDPEVAEEVPPNSSSQVTTGFTTPGVGRVSFHIDVNVDMTEMSSWEAARITAFFTGIAQVLAAKGSIEKEATSA